MAFASVMVLTVAAVVTALVGGLMAGASRGAPNRPLRWSGAAVLCLGIGLLLLLAAPADVDAPVRVFGNTLLMLSCGLFWGGARVFNRRAVPFEAVLAGALAWLVLASLVDPPQGWQIGVVSILGAAYSAATAWEHRAGDMATAPSRVWASRAFAAHGGVLLLRALLGPAFALGHWGAGITAFWNLLLGVEVAGMGTLVAAISILMNRERNAGLHRPESLEDALTGVGNRHALSRSGVPLLAAARAAGRPAAMLVMDLDGFEALIGAHGHVAGDRLLVAFARLAHDYLPPTSLVCRIGGETFAALLPGAEVSRARAVADEIRALFAHLAIPGPHGPVRTTVSVGVATVGVGADDETGRPSDHGLAALLARADLCRASAREEGGDRVMAEGDPRRPVPVRRHSAA